MTSDIAKRLGSLRSFAYGAIGRLGKALAITLAMALPAASQATGTAPTIVALGDSLTQGYGLMDHEGFVPQLRDWLEAHDIAARVENHGVSGDTTAGGLARVDWALGDHVGAMIVALGGNDLLRGLPPEASRANLDGILAAAAASDVEVLLIGLRAPGNYGPEYQAEFDAIYPDLAARYDALYVESFLAPLSDAAGGDLAAAVSAYMQPDGLHPNAAGVALIVEAVGPQVAALLRRVSPAS